MLSKSNGNSSSAYNLDRKDPVIGYTVANCVPCCPRCNLSKGNRFTYEEWVKIGKVIKSFAEAR